MDLGGDTQKGFYIRYTAWTTMMLALLALLVSRGLGRFQLQMPEFLIALILMGSGLMMLLESAFKKDMSFVDPTGLNFLIGIPSALIAIALGTGYILNETVILEVFQGFEGGIYLTAFIILGYQGITALYEVEPGLKKRL